jgi:hypothetical protein
MYSLYEVLNAPRLKVSVSLYHETNIEVEEKPFTSSLNICPETCYRKGVGSQLIRGYFI